MKKLNPLEKQKLIKEIDEEIGILDFFKIIGYKKTKAYNKKKHFINSPVVQKELLYSFNLMKKIKKYQNILTEILDYKKD